MHFQHQLRSISTDIILSSKEIESSAALGFPHPLPSLCPAAGRPSSTGLWGTTNLHLYNSKEMNGKYRYCSVILGFLIFCLNAVLVQKAVFPERKTTTFAFVERSLKFWWECKVLTQRAEEDISFQVVIWNKFWDCRGKEEQQLFFKLNSWNKRLQMYTSSFIPRASHYTKHCLLRENNTKCLFLKMKNDRRQLFEKDLCTRSTLSVLIL